MFSFKHIALAYNNNNIVGIGVINALFEVSSAAATDQEICIELTLTKYKAAGEKKKIKKEGGTEKEMVNSELPYSSGTRYMRKWVVSKFLFLTL